MFVLKSTHEKAVRELQAKNSLLKIDQVNAENDLEREKLLRISVEEQYRHLRREYDKLYMHIEFRGGQDFLDRAVLPEHAPKGGLEFTEKEIKQILSLIHPDKHDGKESAKIFTQKLLTYRDSLR